MRGTRAELTQGQLFAGYVIEKPLGAGGFGTVYLARHPRLPRMVALKLLGEHLHNDPTLIRRFELEADTIAALEHPNVVTVHDRGVEAGRLWIAMQYIAGSDAAAATPPGGMAVDRALRIVAETACGLDFAHARGIVHRDVKPANILLSADDPERVVLTDFGIARPQHAATLLTATGTFIGSFDFASPEHCAGDPVDGRSDQYSLACTLYWLLSARTLFQATTKRAIIAAQLTQPPPPISTLRPELRPLDAVLARALDKEPANRFASCSEFATHAMRAIQDSPGSTMYVPPRWVTQGSLPTLPGPMRPPHPSLPPPAPAARRTWSTGAVLGIAVAVVVATAVFASCVRMIGAVNSPSDPSGDISTTASAAVTTSIAAEELPGWPTGSSFITGSVTITGWKYTPLAAYDLDENELDEHGLGSEGKEDLQAQMVTGVSAGNGAKIARWNGPQAPTLQDCVNLPAGDWDATETISPDDFVTPTVYCARSSAGRYGRIATLGATIGTNVSSDFTFSFVLWKKRDDK